MYVGCNGDGHSIKLHQWFRTGPVNETTGMQIMPSGALAEFWSIWDRSVPIVMYIGCNGDGHSIKLHQWFRTGPVHETTGVQIIPSGALTELVLEHIGQLRL